MNNDTGIYSITSPSGKKYVGSAVSFERRWKGHLHHLKRRTHHSTALQCAYDKYGENGLVFEKIALCPVTDLLVVEQRFIDTLSPEYNMCRVAGSVLGLKRAPFTEVHRKALGSAKRGKKTGPRNDAFRATMSRVRIGIKFSDAHRAALSAWQIGKQITEVQRAALAATTSARQLPVQCVELGIEFPSTHAAQRWLRENGHPKADAGSVARCCKGRLKKSYGYTWRFTAITSTRKSTPA